ncbi:MAG: hypothetical protein ABIA63_07750 [bacterium]
MSSTRLFPCLLLILVCILSPPSSFANDSLKQIMDKLNRLEQLIMEINESVKELKDSAHSDSNGILPKPLHTVRSADSIDKKPSEPIAIQLLRPERKVLIQSMSSIFKTTAFGYSINNTLPSGMSFYHWFNKWGVKSILGIYYGSLFGDKTSSLQFAVSGLRSIHTFDLFNKEEFFHLYSVAGTGLEWERKYYSYSTYAGIDSGSYDVPNLQIECFIGFGTEILFFDGTKIAPEIGYRFTYYAKRYQDSKLWPSNNDKSEDYYGSDLGERPKSNYSLDLYLGINLNFYFR